MKTDQVWKDKDHDEYEHSVKVLNMSDNLVKFVTFHNTELELTKDQFYSQFEQTND